MRRTACLGSTCPWSSGFSWEPSHVRDWLRDADRENRLPGGATIHPRFLAFSEDLPVFCSAFHLHAEELTFNDLTTLVDEWLKVNTL